MGFNNIHKKRGRFKWHQFFKGIGKCQEIPMLYLLQKVEGLYVVIRDECLPVYIIQGVPWVKKFDPEKRQVDIGPITPTILRKP